MTWQDITLENISAAPLRLRVVALLALSAVVMGLFFLLDLHPLQQQLQRAQMTEATLRSTYQNNYQQAAQRDAYQQQIQQLQRAIQQSLTQLPPQIDIATLLTDITRAGAQSGLQFNFIKPLAPVSKQYYHVFPIAISVNGNYKQLAAFITQLSQLHDVVTVNDVHIKRAELTHEVNNLAGSSTPDKTLLVMQLTLQAYQQLPEGEPRA